MEQKLLFDLLPVVRIEEYIYSLFHILTNKYRFYIAVFGEPHLNIFMVPPVSRHQLSGSVLL